MVRALADYPDVVMRNSEEAADREYDFVLACFK
jgi:hypothetical protein